MQDGHVVLADGTQEWRLGGNLHREGDQPARILTSGTQIWYRNGQQHREGDQPAVIGADGTRVWYWNGQQHREGDQPAVIMAHGTHEWRIHGLLHREGDQPARIWPSGTQEWHQNNKLHREGDQPAVIWSSGSQEWWTDGTRTRTMRVTDFRETSDRFALVRTVVAIGVVACEPCDTGSALGSLLQAVHTLLPCDASSRCYTSSYHVSHEYAFLVALFL